MKKIVLLAAAVTVLSSGCAINQRDPGLDNVDVQRVALIDRVDRAHGITVKWINYPQRRSNTPIIVDPILPTGT